VGYLFWVKLLRRPSTAVRPVLGCPRTGPAPALVRTGRAQDGEEHWKTVWTTVLKETRKLPGPTRGRDRTSIAELLADERCSQAVLQSPDFRDYRRRSDVRPTGGRGRRGCGGEASEWEARDQAERAWERREEEERLGVE